MQLLVVPNKRADEAAYTEGSGMELTVGLPVLQDERDTIVRVTLASICTSNLHIKHGSVPCAVLGTTVGHEMVGIVEKWAMRSPLCIRETG